MSSSVSLHVNDRARVGDARRMATGLAREAGLNETEAAKVGIVVTEAATNLLKHASRGHILLRVMDEFDSGLEVTALDKGPGMNDVGACLADGFSTAGSPGTGLGAISRLSDVFDVYSAPNHGTVIMSRLLPRSSKRSQTSFEVGAICVSANESEPCGDSWCFLPTADGFKLLVVDGLGHGPFAADAAMTAARVFRSAPARGPAELIKEMHGQMRSTRGASLAIAQVNVGTRNLIYAGVGNISGVILESGVSRSMVSLNGTVGHELQSVREFAYPWRAGATLIMHSDGLQSRWKVDSYPGLLPRHPAVLAGVLFRDFLRGRDDATVVVVRAKSANDIWSRPQVR